MKYCPAELMSLAVLLQARHRLLPQHMAWPLGASSQQAAGPTRSSQQASLATWSMIQYLTVPMCSQDGWGSCICTMPFFVYAMTLCCLLMPNI